jgi:hypothetical protein
MTLGPAQVHPEEHLRPIRRLGPTGACADRQDRRTLVVLAVEQELGSGVPEVRFEGRRAAAEFCLELGVPGFVDQLDQGQELVRSGQEALPQADLRAQTVRLTEDPLGGPLVIPEGRLLGQCVELGDAGLACCEVKDAPRSTESGPPGREWQTRPLGARGLGFLEQDRTELDEAQRALAPGDDGVHAGTIAVVGADAAVAITVQRSRIAAVPAIAFAGDEIDE